jgi:SAM-dependent methyltransferase
VQLLAALPSLPFELTYHMPQDLVRLRQDLMHLPLLGMVDHRPQRPLSLFRSLAQQLNLPIVPFSSRMRHGRSAAGVSAGQVGALSSGSLLIADPLHDPILRQTWILRARDLAHRSNTSVRLLVLDDNASLPELLATGRVLRLPELPGIPLHELVQLVGCKAAVTQSGETSAGRVALSLANRLNLPLLSATAFVPALWRSEFRETTQVLQAQHQHLKYQETAASMTDAPPKATALSSTAEQSTQDVARSDEPDASARKTFLNIGCGNTASDRLPALFQTKQWQQLRLDIDPAVNPDITASSSDLSAVEDESVAAVYTSHTLEHLEPHEVPVALREMCRVLTADGFALITLPDLQAVAQLIVDGRLTETAYESPVGPITALDMVYGHRDSLVRGNRYMAHRTGFDTHHLGESLLAAGFAEVRVRKGHCYDLWAFAFKQVPNSDPPWLSLPMNRSKNAT